MHEQRNEAGTSLTGRQAHFALAIFLLAYVLSFVDRQILSLMVDPIRRDLGISDLQIGLLQGAAFALLYAVLGVPIGMLADRLVRKRIIALGVGFWSIATGLCGFAGSYATLFVARMGVGLGEAALSPTAHSFLSDAFPPARLARAMAIYSLGITLGGGAAFMIGGSVIDLVARSGATTLPLIGPLKSWQLAFLIVALPGLLIAPLVLLVTEPRRRGAMLAPDLVPERPTLAAVLRYVTSNWRAFVPIYLTSSLLGILGYSMMSWYPTLLIRSFGLSPGEAGHYVGLIYLLLGSAGSIIGGLLAERLAARGQHDANLRVVAIVSGAVALPAVAAPLMDGLPAMLLLFAPATFLQSGFFGASIAAIQLTTPNRMRATNAALFLLANNLIGLSLGAAIVPLTDQLFFGGKNLGAALAVIAAAVCPLSLMLARWGLAPYRALVLRNMAAP